MAIKHQSHSECKTTKNMENNTPKYVTVLKAILTGLVRNPDQVEVTRTRDDMGILLAVKLADGDAGRVIGKEGALIDAIRRVVRSVGRTEEARVNVKLEVPELHKEKSNS